MTLISLRNVSARKYDTIVLSGLEWNLEKGENWAIVGPNGSGKTTFLEILSGKTPVLSGQMVRQLQKPVREAIEMVANDYSFNRIVSAGAEYYQQRFHAYEAERAPTLRAILTDQLRPVGTIDDKSVSLAPPSVSNEELDKICEMLSLTHLLDQPFVTLSNGETRRMLLAKSLLKKPEILMLDNAFSGLDVHSRGVLRNALGELVAQGISVVMATTATEIPDCVTHVLELSEGKIVAVQPVSDFQAQAHLAHFIPVSPAEIAHFGYPGFTDFENAFELRHTRVKYMDKLVLDDVNWKVAKGEKWALSGANGSGKSTLLSILTADNPQRFANDYDLFDQKRGGMGASIWDIKQKIGHVSPELHLYFPRETPVFKTIASGFFDATGIFFRKLNEEQTDRVHEVARLLHVADLMDKDFSQLSKGKQRMILLARALVKNPPLLILDEPCQGMDTDSIEYFKTVVDAICDTPDRTLVYVSHYPHEIPSCVTKFLKLEKGKVVGDV